MRILGAFLTMVLAIYSGVQSYRIAAAGAVQQIPQLQGDGGGGLVFAVLCLIGAVVLLKRPFIATWILAVATVLVAFVGLSFGDPAMYWWSGITLVLTVYTFMQHRLLKRQQNDRYGLHSKSDRKEKRNRATSGA